VEAHERISARWRSSTAACSSRTPAWFRQARVAGRRARPSAQSIASGRLATRRRRRDDGGGAPRSWCSTCGIPRSGIILPLFPAMFSASRVSRQTFHVTGQFASIAPGREQNILSRIPAQARVRVALIRWKDEDYDVLANGVLCSFQPWQAICPAFQSARRAMDERLNARRSLHR
jgi:hypothetical protein